MNVNTEKKENNSYYCIQGYYFNGDFIDSIFCEEDSFVENDIGISEEDVFFYGLRKDQALKMIDEKTGEDFIITEVSDYKKPCFQFQPTP